MESRSAGDEGEASSPVNYCYRFGSAEFDETWFELRVAGLRVEVERRALEVLAYLLRHAGEVVTKEELLDEVWAGRITVEKVLPNAIVKLRRALGEANAELLLTQPRIGYRMNGKVERVAVGRKLASRLELKPGQLVPGRENFVLTRQLGGTRGSEVWLAEHAKTHERRVYKFGLDGERLRALKREATLSRVLREMLEDHEHFVELIDWNFEAPPFFLECEYGGDSLYEWARTGLAATTVEQRLDVFLQIADAVAAAHSVGVLHKDLKPANVLIAGEEQGWRIRLTDFGSGRLLDPERLEELGITQFGLTATQGVSTDSSTGTPLYVAPEVFAGHTPTAQSDVYALGILLYQMLAGDLSRPMASSWEQDVADELLREDVRLATDGDPARRLASAGELATRLRHVAQRRAQARRLHEDEAQARAAREQLARSRARRPYLIALAAAMLVGIAVVLVLYQTALHARDAAQAARNAAQRELQRATAINRFLNEDLIGRSNPLVAAKGKDASLREVLVAARDRVARRFPTEPLTEASIHTSLGMLFNGIALQSEAEAEERRALALYEREEGPASRSALTARTRLARYLVKGGKFDEGLEMLQTAERLTAGSDDPYTKYLKSAAWALYYMSRWEFAKGLSHYRVAVPLAAKVDPDNVLLRDTMRMDMMSALSNTGQVQEAKELGQHLLEEVSARGDDKELLVALIKEKLAEVFKLEGDFDAAEAYTLEAQRTVVRLLGEDHTRNVILLDQLADLAGERRNWPAALDYADRAYEGMRTKFGDDSSYTNAALASVGEFLYESGQAREGKRRLAAAYPKLVAQFGAENPTAQHAGFWLAAAQVELGELDLAAGLLETLDEKVLQESDVHSDWKFRLAALRGLFSSKRGDAAAAASLEAAVNEARKSAVGEMLYTRATQVLAASGGKSG